MPQDAFLGVHTSQVALINKALKPGPVGLHWAQSIIETARSGEGGRAEWAGGRCTGRWSSAIHHGSFALTQRRCICFGSMHPSSLIAHPGGRPVLASNGLGTY